MNAIAIISPALIDIMIGHSFTVILIPLLIALFYFSTSHSRRQLIFILNVFTVSLAFAVGIMGDSRAVRCFICSLSACCAHT
jgi:predicted RND superfamily exporter protein